MILNSLQAPGGTTHFDPACNSSSTSKCVSASNLKPRPEEFRVMQAPAPIRLEAYRLRGVEVCLRPRPVMEA